MGPKKTYPYEIETCSAEEDRLVKKCFVGYTSKFIKCGKHKYIMPGQFRKCAESIYNMEVRPDDVWVITFPRSGTTWTQELVWLLMNDLDYETSREKPLFERFPMLETTSLIPTIGFELLKMNFMNIGNFQGIDAAVRYPSCKAIDEMPRSAPRFIKTHLPLSLLPPNLLNTAKVVYVARDPRDACVSYYYMQKMVAKHLLRAKVTHYWEALRRDLLTYTPIVPHANEAWEQRHHPNMHFMFYEDMLKDLPNEIRRVSDFLGRKYADNQLNYLSHYLKFDSLKKNKSVNNNINSEGKNNIQFIRKGEAGGWRAHFDKKMELEAEDFFRTKLHGLTLRYPSVQTNEITHL